jgi:hypothetical protein
VKKQTVKIIFTDMTQEEAAEWVDRFDKQLDQSNVGKRYRIVTTVSLRWLRHMARRPNGAGSPHRWVEV